METIQRDSDDNNLFLPPRAIFPPSSFSPSYFSSSLRIPVLFFLLSLPPEQSNVTIVRWLKTRHPYRKRETLGSRARESLFQTFSFLSLSGLFTPSQQPQTDRSPSPFTGGFTGQRVDQKRPWILGEPVRIMPDTSRCRFTGY